MKSIKLNLEIWKSCVNKIGEMIFNDEYLISQIFKKDNSNFELFKTKYENNMVKYKSDKRFAIPIIGKISSGKSTFLNCILQSDILSSSSNIDTKFICLLRHNKDLKSPILYKCELIKANIDYKYEKYEYYYFKKKNVIEGNIKENIKTINEHLIEYEKKYTNFDQRDLNEYFYILELKIPLFNMNEELGDFFDLMDVPGLNENNDFYLKYIIPKIVDKCLFSIFIFDISHFQNNDSLNVYVDYSNLLNKVYNSNSIYILNKIDNIHEIPQNKTNPKNEDYYFEVFKNFLSDKNQNSDNKNSGKFKVDWNQNSFLALSSKEIYNKINSYLNLKIYIQFISDNIKEEERDSVDLLEEIKGTFLKCFDISIKELENIINDTNNNNYKDYYDKNEFENISEDIVNNNLTHNFDDEEDLYCKFKYIIDKKPKKCLPIHELNKIYNTILDSMEKSSINFFDWKKVEELFEIYKESVHKTFEENEKDKYIKICEKLLNSFRKEIEWKLKLKSPDKWNIDIIDPLKTIIDFLINLEKDNKPLQDLQKDFISLTYFIYNYRKIRIPVLGGYSTGKSSFLNNLIGKDILPVDILCCTNKGIIIRHSSNNCPQLFYTKFKKVENPVYWYFEDEEKPICEGYEQIKKQLLLLNEKKDKNFEDAFVVIKVPLKLFSELEFTDSNLKNIFEDKLELIDFPGLDVNNPFFEKEIFTPLMIFSDGFIFVNECDLIEEIGNLKILDNIMNEIRSRKFRFSYRACFFLLHKLDKSLDINVEKAKEIFEKLFEKEIADNEWDKEGFNVNKFSSKLYHFYREYTEKYTKNFEHFVNYIVQNLIKQEDKIKIKDYKGFLNNVNNISKRLTFQINKKLIKKNNKEKEKNFDTINDILYKYFEPLKLELNIKDEEFNNTENTKMSKDIYYNYLYISKNHKFHKQRILSNANGLFASLYKLFENSYEYTETQFNNYFNKFIDNFNNLLISIDIKIYGSQLDYQLYYNEIEKQNNDYEKEANDIFKDYEDKINKLVENCEIANKNIIQNFIADYNINKNEYIKNGKKIEENIQDNTKELLKNINDNLINKINNLIKKMNENEKNEQKKYKLVTSDDKNKDKLVTNVKNISIDSQKYSLNINTSTIENYTYNNHEKVINFFKVIGNIAIKIYNYSEEKEKIIRNLNDYLMDINKLIRNYKKALINEIEVKKEEIMKIIHFNLETVNNIKNKREEYEKIKKKFLNIIS